MSLDPKTSGAAYRPDIDGLRAIAVLSVLFYHVGLGCPGGYIGVDVFFVISGYLITSLIVKDLRKDRFSLMEFWERRMRRIFPALAVTVFFTLVAGWFLLLPEHLEKLGRSTVAQALLSANFYFWRTTNYFGGANEEKPLLHTWSLAVEEQFYLFFPLILMFLFRREEFRRARVLVATLLVGFAASLGIAVWGVKHQPYATFFLLPTRAWELICGALIAVLPVTAIPTSRLIREVCSWFGLAAILFPVCLYSENTQFPGLAALPPCVGTALLIWANSYAPRHGSLQPIRTLPAALLSLRGVAFIGLISYSLYLWHWPVLAFSNYWKTASFTPVMRWSLVSASLVMAILSWRYVETPFRKRSVCGSRSKIFGFAAALTMLSSVSGLAAWCGRGYASRLPSDAVAILTAVQKDSEEKHRKSSNFKAVRLASDVFGNKLPRLGNGNSNAPIEFMIWGDSHAEVALPVFDSLCRRYGIVGQAVIVHSTPPLIRDYHLRLGSQEAGAISLKVVDYIRIKKVPKIFLMGYWASYQQAGGAEKLEESLRATILDLEKSGTKVWVILDWPDYDYDVIRASIRKQIFPGAPLPALRTPSEHRQRNIALYSLAARAPIAEFLDPSPFLQDSEGGFETASGGYPLYIDNNHLTVRGAEKALLPILQPIFQREFPSSSHAQAQMKSE